MITLAIPTLRRYDLLCQAVVTACAGRLPPSRVYIIDNGSMFPPHIRATMQEATQEVGATLDVVTPGYNLGVAASWNLALHTFDDHLIISNDDVTFYRDTISRLVAAAEADPEGLFFFPGSGGYKNAWSLFLQKKRMLEVVGYYDETISPQWAFFEDNDMSRRLELAGYRHIPVAGCAYGHFDSATLHSMSAPEQQEHFQSCFPASKQRYIDKWGGEPGHETYTQPFNGARPQHRNSIYG